MADISKVKSLDGTTTYNIKDATARGLLNGHSVGKDVPSDAEFTDTVTTVSVSGDGNAVTAIVANDGALSVLKGTTFVTNADISGKADKATTVTQVSWDNTNKVITKTINGTTANVVTASKILENLTKSQVTGALGYTPPTTDTDTHRPIQVNGTETLGNNTTALNLKAGSNVNISASSGDVTISATDTTYSSKTAASGGTDVSLVTTGEKYTWNNKGSGTITGIKMNGASKGTSGVVDLGTVITAHQDISGKMNASLKGAANGVAELDSTGKVPSSQLPSYVDDVLEYDSQSAFPTTGEAGKIYVAKDTNKTYRWSGTAYVEISPSLALGETSSTAYRGDRGKTAYDHSQSAHARTDATAVAASSTNGNIKINGTETTVYTHPGSGTNPHGTTKSDVGLGNVGNFLAVSTAENQGLTDTEKSNARTNIGAGTSSLALGTSSSTAYRGDRGNSAYKHAVTNKGSAFASGLYKITTNSEGHVTAATAVEKADITGLGIPESDTNTHRPIQVNGTEVLGNNTTALNLKAGSNVTVTNSSGTVTIAATDTTYSSKTAASGGTDVSLVTTGEKYTWNNKGSYSKPSGGIPDSDIASASTWNAKGTYSKPSGGIPKTDLASAVQTSLGKADSALQSHQTIKQDGVTGATVNRFGTCSTAAATAAKAVSITTGTFSLEAGAMVAVKFSNANSASSPTLNVASTGAKNIFVNGAKITTNSGAKSLLKGTVVFIYDGTQYHLIGNYADTTYSDATTSAHGLMTAEDKTKLNALVDLGLTLVGSV